MDTQVARNPVDVIVRKIRRFPQETRRYIINAALLDLDRDLLKPNGPDRYAILKSIAEKATGHILTDSRSRENTEVRMLIASQMRSEGFTLEEIGLWMEKDHSTVTHYCTLLEDAMQYPKMFAELLTKRKTFLKELREYDKRHL